MAKLHTIYFYILRNIGGKFTNVPLNITLCAIVRVKKYKIGNLKIKSSWFFFFCHNTIALKLYGCCLFSCCRNKWTRRYPVFLCSPFIFVFHLSHLFVFCIWYALIGLLSRWFQILQILYKSNLDKIYSP